MNTAVTPTTAAAAATPATSGSIWAARTRNCSIARLTFFFGLTRSAMASMVRASSARVRSMSATSAAWLTGFAPVSASAISISVSWAGPFGNEGIILSGPLRPLHHLGSWRALRASGRAGHAG
jgi:hypothetical protein